MKRFWPLLVFVVVLFALSFGGLIWWKVNTAPVSNDKTPIRFVIPKGRSAAQIAQILYEDGLIKNPLAFKFYVQLTGRADKIQAGEFQLARNLTPGQIIEELSKGPLQLWVTIPEGLRREEVVEKFITGLEMQEPQSSQFRNEFLQSSKELEGQLFPDTYLFPRDISASIVVGRMKSLFDEKVTKGLAKGIEESNLSFNQIVTLASIIERETRNTDERPIVAGILLNRIDMGMPLQADATVQFAVGEARCVGETSECNWWPVLTKQDLEIDSPYNTYKYKGLPPMPIANPGLSSLKAAVQPQPNDYLYYIHDKDGNIHYAKNLQEHDENVREYLGK
jgi:UPF0755 protein